MINNNIHVKIIDSLRMRKKAVEKSYSIAGWMGFWMPVFLLGVQVVHFVLRLLVLDMGMVSVMIESTSIPLGNIYFEFNYPPMIACLLFVVLGYFAFGARRRPAQYLFMALAVVFIAVSFIMIMKNYEKATYTVSVIYCTAMIFVCADCIKAHKEDELLSRSDGYPHFNPVLMYEEKTEEKSLIRFPDKKSYDQLYDERMEEYAVQNPDSETAKAYVRVKEEKKEIDIENWLSAMLEKDAENQQKS